MSKILTSSTRFSALKWGTIPRFPRSCAIFLRTRASFSCWKCSMSSCITLWGIWSPSTRLSSNFSSCCNACWELDTPRRFTWTSFVGGFCTSFSFLIGFGSSWDEFSYRSHVNLCIQFTIKISLFNYYYLTHFKKYWDFNNKYTSMVELQDNEDILLHVNNEYWILNYHHLDKKTGLSETRIYLHYLYYLAKLCNSSLLQECSHVECSNLYISIISTNKSC